MSSDIRKWFIKQHDKGNGTTSKPEEKPSSGKPTLTIPEKPVSAAQEAPSRKKTSKYFASSSKEEASKEGSKDEKSPGKRKIQTPIKEEFKPTPAKKPHVEKKVKDEEIEEDDDFVKPAAAKKSKGASGTAVARKSVTVKDELEEEESPAKGARRGRGSGGRGGASGTAAARKSVAVKDELEEEEAPAKGARRGRGSGGRGAGSASGGRGGRGGGRGGFMNFGERKDPPHKGEKEIPEGTPECLSGLTFVISGTLDSLEREEAEDLIKCHGGRVTGSVSKKTSYLLCDEDIGGRKSQKAQELGVPFLTEDGLFDLILKSKPSGSKTPNKKDENGKLSEKVEKLQTKSSPAKHIKKDDTVSSTQRKEAPKSTKSSISPDKKKIKTGVASSLTWTEKYKPKAPSDIIGNQSIAKQLQDWLNGWDNQFLHAGQKGKGKKQADSGSKKAVLMSGSPGIGKSTTAKLVSEMLGFQPIEVNASDSRGKADSKIVKGIGGSTSNSIKELVNNATLNYGTNSLKQPKSVLIMDEVDGMSAGDRGGVADLIASIKISKIPIICICNDRYSQKLKSLVNHCLLLNFRKPTKQQMAKRVMQIANFEGLQVNEVALEELANRVNGDMRLAINQLQYMSLQMSVIKYDDVRERLKSSAKDEDISPFTAVDKLFGFDGGKLRMDERIDYSMSDPDLVPLIIQENYINYKPVSIGKDESGVKRMKALARAAESISDGDIVNVQIRRYRQWQLSQASSFASSIVPAAVMHGHRETLEPGERNFNRFGGWLGKNSSMGKNMRLLEDVHVHILASQQTNLDRETLRVDYLTLLLKQLTDPLCRLPKDEAVQKVVELMDTYSLSQEDFDTIVELSKLKGQRNPMEGIQSIVKAALTRAYKQGSSTRVIRSADLITLPGVKKAPKKRIAAILEPPVETETAEENGIALVEGEEENSSDAEDDDQLISDESKPKLDLQSDKSKGIQVQLDLKNSGDSKAKKATPASKSKATGSAEKPARGSSGKRKR
ncbi:Replication factor C subunit 1 [Rhynchospora pubera]|uniref:Replication factor C subunit 1 n=1 Tax=Rhynchospora pubera TaxID=906938 RepID=A0AAV8D5I7_9POAL|nr:Replication factor C subunit 1 [Rhynchospora pubera]